MSVLSDFIDRRKRGALVVPPKPLTKKEQYALYLESDRWSELRCETLERDGHRCMGCNADRNLQVHHRAYPKVWGDETVDDLTTLCRKCHNRIHNPPTCIEEARDEHFQLLKDGEALRCAVCDKHCKYDKRNLNSGMARALCRLVMYDRYESDNRGDWIDVQKNVPELHRTKQHSTLKHWGLVESRKNVDPTKKGSGFWRPTELGIEFAEARVTVAHYVWLYNDTVVAISGDQTDIRQSLGAKFNYADHMKPAPIE